ncbi:MAG: rhodanese-like domain-containing protein [Alphaproteobacteria bacterium]|nr:rhodanese-like domain-containing protein [Alphaproteobacteria bacterium]
MTYDNIQVIDAGQAQAWIAEGKAVVVDVREENEFLAGHIPGATLLPLSRFNPGGLPKVPEGKKLLIHCRSGQRCGMAATFLASSGYQGDIHRLSGGIIAWAQAGGAVVAGR